MRSDAHNITPQQQAVISHDGSAFISACPGAGKTRVMTERARHLLNTMPIGRGVAFLSFTEAAVSELETRLRREGLLPTPVFPNFIGTFDSFLWQFLVAPFGTKNCGNRPRIIPDIDNLPVNPYPNAQVLTLSCFCRQTGEILGHEANRLGFDVSTKKPYQIQKYKETATRIRASLREQGLLDFDDARAVALERIRDTILSRRIAAALAGRFCEIAVDEAQDCNPNDLTVISWLRGSGLPVKVVCDPHQSIYGFRGGVTDHLFEFAETFAADQRIELTDNFRSTPNICKAIAQFRSSSKPGSPDNALGPLQGEHTPVMILSYSSQTVPPSIGTAYCALLRETGIEVASAPIIAATRRSSAVAAGQAQLSQTTTARTVRLANAVMDFHFASGYTDMKVALGSVHRILLEIEGRLDDTSYNQYLSDNEIEPASWRSKAVAIVRKLRFDPTKHQDAREWHSAAKKLLSEYYIDKEQRSISQTLRWNDQLNTVLTIMPTDTAMPRTIHSVKGMEFPAVCVVTTSSTLKGILDFLETGRPTKQAEEARKLYVAASRAQKLLVIAAPKSQAERLRKHLSGQGADVSIKQI